MHYLPPKIDYGRFTSQTSMKAIINDVDMTKAKKYDG